MFQIGAPNGNAYTEVVRPACTILLFAALAADGQVPTFYRDVLPILQNRCQECHRPGEMAPMAFLTYSQTRPWAIGSIAETGFFREAATLPTKSS